MKHLVKHTKTNNWFLTTSTGELLSDNVTRKLAESMLVNCRHVKIAYLYFNTILPEWVPVEDKLDEWNFETYILN